MDTIFVVDDEQELCTTIQKVFVAEGYRVLWTTHPEEFLSKLPGNTFSCLLLDLKLGGSNGIDYLEKILETDPHLPIIIITAYETVKTAVEAMKRGAFHYLPKPFDNEELKALVANAVKMRHLYWELKSCQLRKEDNATLEMMMGSSPAIQNLAKQISAVAQIDVNVLFTGESGTGKELVAKTLHHLSPRRKGPFVPIDCASIPETLIESELFGHEKGAFTGAHAARKGKVEQANGGILFLDEIANIPLNIQAKLLRFLETHTFERLGGGVGSVKRPINVSLRVIAATNRELSKLVKEGNFREDLFHRLNEFPINLPPLRERSHDIPYLSLRFLHEFESQIGKTVSGFDPKALDLLQSYPWPGNVRELKNALKRAMVIANGKIQKTDLPPEIRNPKITGVQTELTIPIRHGLSLFQASKESVSFVEKQLIQTALQKTEGHKGKAAKLLEIDEKTLYNKLKVYRLS
ncbi:MAG: sigma-54-dependent Fis family transcriptional regulator [Deltaproteobacteria bacterium]|nr:sigma-54-dependent Fis family transcriptional regulator [Deltaproteobacteria bacterium]